MFPSSFKEHENMFWVFNIGGDKPAPRGVCFWRCGCGGFSSDIPTGWFSGNLPLTVELELRNPRLELLNDEASGRAFVLEDELFVVLKHDFALELHWEEESVGEAFKEGVVIEWGEGFCKVLPPPCEWGPRLHSEIDNVVH